MSQHESNTDLIVCSTSQCRVAPSSFGRVGSFPVTWNGEVDTRTISHFEVKLGRFGLLHVSGLGAPSVSGNGVLSQTGIHVD